MIPAKIKKLKKEKRVDSVVPVMNDWIRPWSPIRCMMSPMFLASKKRIGNLINLAIKSEIKVMLIRVFMCRLIQLWMKPTPVWVIDSTSCDTSINVIKFRLLFPIPWSTMACVRKGKMREKTLPNSIPIISWNNCDLYGNRYRR